MAIPMKSEYGPTLGGLLAPRWHAASRTARTAVVVIGLALLAALIGAGLTLENSSYSHAGSPAFSFSYRDLFRVPPDPGGYVKVQAREPDGTLKYSYAVNPLRLPPHAGEPFVQMPVFAAGYISRVARTYPDFVLRGEGKTKINNTLTGYDVLYTTTVDGREMFGRDVLLVPEHPRARDGVAIVMLTATNASSQVTSPTEVATTGVLLRPLKTFSWG